MQLPPPTGHWKTLVVALDEAVVVGVNCWTTVQVPGPVKPPPAPQVSNENPNGALIPDPEAICVRKPASTVIVTVCVTVVLIGTSPNATLPGFATAVCTPVPLTE